MQSPVYIHGLGLITPLGHTLSETFTGIVAGRMVTDAGVVPDAFLEPVIRRIALRQIPDSVLPVKLDRSILLGLHAALAACQHAQWPGEYLAADDSCLFVATSKGPSITWISALDAMRNSPGHRLDEDQAWHIAMGAGAMGAATSAVLGCHGKVHTTVAACAGSLVAVHRAVRALRAGECRRALVLAADSSLHPLFDGCYANLGVLAAPGSDGHRRCQPLTGIAGGFVVSQAGAAVALSLDTPRATEANRITIDATWLGSEGYHLVAADPSGVRLSDGMRAMRSTAPGPSGRTAFVHAHAAGTAHDAVELAAIRHVFGDVPVFSHKKWLGHSLGASGLVGLTLSAACHQHGCTLAGDALPRGSASVNIAQGFGGIIGMCRLGYGRNPTNADRSDE